MLAELPVKSGLRSYGGLHILHCNWEEDGICWGDNLEILVISLHNNEMS